MATQTEATINLPIEQLTNCNLLGNLRRGLIYPVTVTHAVKSLDFDGEPIEGVECCLEDRLRVIEKTLGIGGDSSSDNGCCCTAITVEDIESLIGKTSNNGSSDNDIDTECDCTAITEEAIESLLD